LNGGHGEKFGGKSIGGKSGGKSNGERIERKHKKKDGIVVAQALKKYVMKRGKTIITQGTHSTNKGGAISV
jgi:hypothetical protein